jgi:hypothetical protein
VHSKPLNSASTTAPPPPNQPKSPNCGYLAPFVKLFFFSLLVSIPKTKTLTNNPKYKALKTIFTFISNQNTFSN